MQTVPSLVGAGTVVAAAATGLVFGQPADPTNPRPGSTKRKLAADFDVPHSLPSSRPGTSVAPGAGPHGPNALPSTQRHADLSTDPYSTNTSRRSAPPTSQTTPPKTSSRRHSFIRQPDLAARPVTENSRDSVSSSGSWIRRLSIRPLSQHGSPRSSICPDSSSMVFSQGSGAPILSPADSHLPQLPPNKLVKRTAANQNSYSGTLTGRSLRSTFRRPATSHQRSATLKQFQQSDLPSILPVNAKYSLDQGFRPAEALPSSTMDESNQPPFPTNWVSFFHFRSIKEPRRGSSTPGSVASPNKRILPRCDDSTRAYLVKPSMITSTAPSGDVDRSSERVNRPEDEPQSFWDSKNSAEETPFAGRPRRSMSTHFSTPSSWISRTGSLRRSKRAAGEVKADNVRNSSAPTQFSPQTEIKPALVEIFTSHDPHLQLGLRPTSASYPKNRKRNSSSPLPQLSRISSFNIDLDRLANSAGGSPTASSPQRQVQTPTALIPASNPNSIRAQPRTVSGERASTMASSDIECRDLTSGEDDDTDFKSDAMFDSFRTVGSSRARNVETPLESMFDESPPSTAGNGRTKRLSIQEILGHSWDGDTKILEEDESVPTPVYSRDDAERPEVDDRRSGVEERSLDVPMSPDLHMTSKDFARLSLDDDDEDDWTRDEDNTLSNHLFPPTSSLNSRRANPLLRHALASISGNGLGSTTDRRHDPILERPRSTLFDWSEPPGHDKFEVDGHSPRPKTVHGKQEMDLRGSRTASRKGPSIAHVRSQSVPVVPEPADGAKNVPKYGTWGLGTKPASEDWDDDFDFDETAGPLGGKDSATSFSMVVPPSIQATQPTVKAHSGQIRELSLLVNDLKRLCRHGKDLDILQGQYASKWKEAENIIELASPDEEEEDREDADDELEADELMTERGSPPLSERFVDQGFDASSLDQSEDPFTFPDSEISKTAVVRERQSVRRRSVFSPDDDIFGGNWPLKDESPRSDRPKTPDESGDMMSNSAMISTVMEAMQQQRSTSDSSRRRPPVKPSQSKLFFDTNSLQELVKKASQLRDSLSDVVRRAEFLTQSPQGTPRRERVHRLSDGSPAFTRVFTDPASSPPMRLPQSHSTNSVLSRTSMDSSRLQMMTVK
ncbi:hypothetical protein VTK73DRAFT_4296 [Phialemonium thermophilum]|uniref:Uncharacterized protein n=1 Tax=Phialemonium thermophilum TaxID=223376 RepID=A0ABR3WUF4_9PEZI